MDFWLKYGLILCPYIQILPSWTRWAFKHTRPASRPLWKPPDFAPLNFSPSHLVFDVNTPSECIMGVHLPLSMLRRIFHNHHTGPLSCYFVPNWTTHFTSLSTSSDAHWNGGSRKNEPPDHDLPFAKSFNIFNNPSYVCTAGLILMIFSWDPIPLCGSSHYHLDAPPSDSSVNSLRSWSHPHVQKMSSHVEPYI